MTQRPDLIVPVRDRRRRTRILTLPNFLKAFLVVAVIFAGVTIRSEMRGKHAGDYGRLFGKQVSRQNELSKPVYDVVKEVPVSDQTAPDPLLLEASNREQILIDPTTTAATATVAPPPVTIATTTPIGIAHGGGVAIVGGTDGVTIVRTDTSQRPKLSGGIFKQP